MKRIAAATLLAALGALGALAQDADSIILAYQRNFARSSIVTKLELVKEASLRTDADMGPLFEMALRFAVDYSPLLGPDPQLKSLALVSAAATGETGYAKAADALWSLFQISKDEDVRAATMAALGSAGAGDPRMADRLGAFLSSQNELLRSGLKPELPALVACIEALGRLGNAGSFSVLFAAYIAGYPPEVADGAAKALGALKGDYKSFLLQVIAKNPMTEKAAAFSAGMDNPSFDEGARGELAEAALASTLALLSPVPSPSRVDAQALRDLRFASAKELVALKWQKASPLVVKHFKLVQADYAKGEASKAEFLEAVSGLGAMGSIEAAQALALHLQLINAQTEQGVPFDEPVILAVVNALGELGDKAAFDYLLQIGYLRYPDAIKRAAREALLKLKW
jgi:hypothetical protein